MANLDLMGIVLDPLVREVWLGTFLLAIMRVAAFTVSTPLLSQSSVSPSIQGVFVFLVAMIITPHLDASHVPLMMSADWWFAALKEGVLGISISMVLLASIEVLRLAGQAIAYAVQLGFAQMVEPGSKAQSTVISNSLYVFGNLYILAAFGMPVVLAILFDSFHALPVGGVHIEAAQWQAYAYWIGRLWAFGLLLALPSMLLSLMINTGMAIVTRTAPSINIFSVGFPMVIMIGIGALIWFMPHMLHAYGLIAKQLWAGTQILYPVK